MNGTALPVSEPVHVRQARLLASRVARDAGFPDRIAERVAIATSELATNLVKYATDGLLVVVPKPGCLDVLSTDRGPGIEHVPDSLRDGFSTTGTLGVGLGGVRRMADEFDIYSRYGEGTTVLARWNGPAPRHLGLDVGVALFTALGESECGDDWVAAYRDGVATVVLSDGLGHGPEAAVASAAVTSHVGANPNAPLGELVTAMDADMTARRGATVAVAQFDLDRSTVSFIGVGNSTARLFSTDGGYETLVSVPGIVGKRQRSGKRTLPVVRPWTGRHWLIMHTDGISDRWSTADFPDVFDRDPATIAGWLLGGYGRRRDDACALVITGSEVRD